MDREQQMKVSHPLCILLLLLGNNHIVCERQKVHGCLLDTGFPKEPLLHLHVHVHVEEKDEVSKTMKSLVTSHLQTNKTSSSFQLAHNRYQGKRLRNSKVGIKSQS